MGSGILIECARVLDLTSWHRRMVVNQNSQSVADDAKRIYEERLRAKLEESHMNEFVAIEPISARYDSPLSRVTVTDLAPSMTW